MRGLLAAAGAFAVLHLLGGFLPDQLLSRLTLTRFVLLFIVSLSLPRLLDPVSRVRCQLLLVGRCWGGIVVCEVNEATLSNGIRFALGSGLLGRDDFHKHTGGIILVSFFASIRPSKVRLLRHAVRR